MIPDLTSYDVILLNSSGGKDSQAMIDFVWLEALKAGVMDRLIVVHADLGRVEWKGTKELAQRQAESYSIPFMVAQYTGKYGDLLEHVETRGMWPGSKTRYCTSDYKRDAVAKVIRGLPAKRVLNCLGLRAQESPARAKKVDFEQDKRLTNSKRTVDTWLPIHDWSVEQVWDTIKLSGVEYHAAYDLGMPRLSCCFCVFAPKDALVIAGQHNQELLAEYVRVEQKIGHSFRQDMPIAEIQALVQSGYQPKNVQSWVM